MRELLTKLRDWLRRDKLDAELREELRFHERQLERDALHAGQGRNEATWAAQRQLGNVTQVTEDARARWSLPGLDHLQQDIRFALRGLRKSPGFTAAVVVTLALGIGANATMFGVLDRLMFRPLSYLRDPGRVHRVYLQTSFDTRTSTNIIIPYTRYLDLRRETTSFSQTAAFTVNTHGVGTGDGVRQREVFGVSASFFTFFDARPVLGRFLIDGEDATPAGANVAVLGFEYWQAELGGHDVIGESIQVGSGRYTIVGVAPDGFGDITAERTPAVFVPITSYAANEGGGNRVDYYTRYNWDWTQMIVRRRPGVSIEAANADLTAAFVRSRATMRVVNASAVRVERASPRAIAGALKIAAGPNPGLEARTLLWVSGVAVVVLLIACANVANLSLARALRRRRETALRLALGASRWRLAAQSLTESMVLALLGAGAGMVIAQSSGGVLRRLFVSDASRSDVITDGRTLSVAIAAALVAALVSGVSPVLFAGRDDLTTTLKSGAREGSYQRSRARVTLIVAQGALSVALLVGAGLFVRSLVHVRHLRLGYDIDNILLAHWERRGTPMDSIARAALRARLLETALAIPGVEHGTWASNPPFGEGTSIMGSLAVAGIDSVSRLGRFTFQVASHDYFATVGTRILRGRAFSDNDRLETPRVTVVSEAMARTLWPGEDAVGKCIRIDLRGLQAAAAPCITVIGVAENAVHDPASDLPLRYYLPERQMDFGSTTLLLRVRNEAVATEGMRRALQAVMPGQSFITVQPARDLLDQKRRSWLVGATMFVAFGGLALVVAAVGLYGVISYTVSQRMHEVGVRMALGARGWDIICLVVGQGIRFGAAGVVVGSALGLLATRWIEPLLFQQPAKDPAVFGSVGALLMIVALVASVVPALRAMRADPNAVLRTE